MTGSQMNKEKVYNTRQKNGESDDVIIQDSASLPVSISNQVAEKVDDKVISNKFFNSFNFSKLSTQFSSLNLAIGVTSANPQEGKTLVASNMAVSIARGYQRTTLLIDMNFQNPEVHNLFGVNQVPGLAEALEFKTIKVAPTKVENLFVMPAGDCKLFKPGIEHTLILRDIFQTLKKEFDFIIIDMSSILPVKNFPVHFVNETDGLISVINMEKTKRHALGKMFNHVDEKRFVGYVFNKVEP